MTDERSSAPGAGGPSAPGAVPWPVQRVSYGAHPEQFGELRIPSAGAVPAPVAVLLHGGFWLSRWKLDLMDPMADDLGRRGIPSWNVEYRRADLHGWDAMTADVEAAVRHLSVLAGQFPLDLARIVLIGHSAGGQLAVRVAADLLAGGADALAAVRPAVVVSLAGVLDLHEAERRNLGDGAVPAALGATAAARPKLYAASSPLHRVPLGIPQIIVTARDDHPDLNDLNIRYAAAARAAGEDVTVIEGDGDHFTLIDPGSRLWADTCRQLLAAAGRAG
jgi:acetyl esterase/lipase